MAAAVETRSIPTGALTKWGDEGEERKTESRWNIKDKKKVWLSYRLNVGRKKEQQQQKQQTKRKKLTMLNLLAEIKFKKHEEDILLTQKYEVTFGYSLSLPQKNEQKNHKD